MAAAPSTILPQLATVVGLLLLATPAALAGHPTRCRWLLAHTELLLPAAAADRSADASAPLHAVLLDPEAHPPLDRPRGASLRDVALRRGLHASPRNGRLPTATARLLALAPPGSGALPDHATLPPRHERLSLAEALHTGLARAGIALSDRFHPWLLVRHRGRMPLVLSIPSGTVLELRDERWILRPLDPHEPAERAGLAALAAVATRTGRPTAAWLRFFPPPDDPERAALASWFLWVARGQRRPAALRLRTLQRTPHGTSLSVVADRLVRQRHALEDFTALWSRYTRTLERATLAYPEDAP